METNRMIWRLNWELILFYIVLAAVLFWPAGTFDWWGGWVYWAEMVVFGTAICAWLLIRDPALLRERLSGAFQKEQVFWDKVLAAFLQLGFVAWIVFMAFDRRWGLSHMPRIWNYVGAILCPSFYLSCWLVFRANAFASPVVKMQAKQKVATTGPYRFVRHPMYAGGIPYFIGTALLLGSWPGLALVPIFIAFLMLRIPIEERMLKAELEGYEDYMTRVRYRLVPGIW
jgi:protein-S-isoprenylcysteine O-methyltransferase Ste14